MPPPNSSVSASPVSRRRFLHYSATGAGLLILPSGLRAGPNAPSNKLNVALIGVTGRGKVFHDPLAEENVVALCDVNEEYLGVGAKRFPRAKTHVDWRKCLEQKDVDAVVICTADHTHAFVANWAMNRDKHVYCEKPFATSVEEVRLLRSRWLAKRHKLASQVGTGTAANHNRIRELIRDGAIGELSVAYAWGTRQLRRNGYWPAAGAPPSHLHYDLWIGPAPYHPYHPNYFKPGNFVPLIGNWIFRGIGSGRGLLNGDEFHCLTYLEAGYDGCMFGGAVAVAPQMHRIAELFQAGRLDEARAVDQQMKTALFGIYGGESIACWLTGLKYYMVRKGLFESPASFLGYPLTDDCRAFVDRYAAEGARLA